MAKATTQSIEPLIADLANGWLKAYKLDYKLEQESLNTEIDTALNEYFSKSGGKGGKGNGGTGQALRIAKDYNIPIFDCGKYSDVRECAKELKRFLDKILELEW